VGAAVGDAATAEAGAHASGVRGFGAIW